MYIYIYIYMQVCMYVCMYVRVHACIYESNIVRDFIVEERIFCYAFSR